MTAGRAVLVMVLMASAACSGSPPTVEPGVYIEVMARLSMAESRFLDSARADSARRAVLEEYGVDPEALVTFSERYGGDVEFMTGLWRRIEAVVESLEAEGRVGDTLPDSTGPGGP